MARRNKRQAHRNFSKLAQVVFALLIVTFIFGLSYHLVAQKRDERARAPTATSSVLKAPGDFTLEDKIGQMLVVGVSRQSTAMEFEKKYQVGGFLIRPGSDLFSKTATDTLSQAGKIKPIFAVDEEGGQVARLPGADFSLYSAHYMGTLPDATVEQVGQQMGQAMIDIGANLDFAPVVDLDDGQNAAISLLDRSFSNNPAVVTKKAQAFAGGLRQAGVAPVFKHFPGLGNASGPTGGNTDSGSATSPDISYLRQNDLLPYRTLLYASQPSSVMVGNQVVPGLSGGMPASLSASTYDLLRGEYNFNQVAFTDELLLAKAITEAESSPANAVADAIKAGADMPLIDTDDEQTLATIIKAVAAQVRAGQIKQSQIDKSLSRILQLKSWIK